MCVCVVGGGAKLLPTCIGAFEPAILSKSFKKSFLFYIEV